MLGRFSSNDPKKNGGPTTIHSSTSTRHRQQAGRIAGETPYRDDPSLPPRLESLTSGGYGPSNSYNTNGIEKSKDFTLTQKAWRTCHSILCCTYCCSTRPAGGGFATAALADDPDDASLYYEDSFNDLSWTCSFGTSDEDGIWLNQADPAGTIMAILVWVLLLYSALTMTFLAVTGGIPPIAAMAYNVVAAMALASHVKTSLTDPGAVPTAAVPTQEQRSSAQKLSMCSQCQTFKPPLSHHCRICNRCISRMDHHCPWMNNCVGAGNLKHFVLFLIYAWSCSVFALTLLGWNYFFCADESCVFQIVLLQLVRLMTFLGIGTFLFTSSMLMNVVYGIMTGVGTIDRLKKKANGTLNDSEEEPIALSHVFGIGPLWQWPLPMDPIFHDYDVVMGYSTPQRLLREQMREAGTGSVVGSVVTRDSYGMPV
ncbi:hypothetical protein ACA910_001248 [Epithemia clementina (nom. ined.)]